MCSVRMNFYGLLASLCLAGCELSAAHAEAPVRKNAFAVLDQFSESVQALSAQVAPSVVQISVTRYAPREERASGRIGVVLGRSKALDQAWWWTWTGTSSLMPMLLKARNASR